VVWGPAIRAAIRRKALILLCLADTASERAAQPNNSMDRTVPVGCVQRMVADVRAGDLYLRGRCPRRRPARGAGVDPGHCLGIAAVDLHYLPKLGAWRRSALSGDSGPQSAALRPEEPLFSICIAGRFTTPASVAKKIQIFLWRLRSPGRRFIKIEVDERNRAAAANNFRTDIRTHLPDPNEQSRLRCGV
jgi:hypothetical protein